MWHLIPETLNRLRYRIPSRPRQVQLEITNACNLDCQMCPRTVMGIDLEHMEWDTFTGLMDRLTHREEITLTGWGEPFLHPRIFDMIAYCQERGHRVMITSNGVFTKDDVAEKIIAAGLDGLTFSVDSVDTNIAEGHISPKALANIETIARLRKPEKPYLRLQSTLHAGGENDLYGVIRYAAKIGCDAVNVGRVDRKYDPNLKRPSLAEEERIFQKADRLARQSGIQLDWLQYSVSRGLVRFFYRLLRKRLHQSGRYCLKTFDYTYVNREGKVTPCCLLPQTQMGDALTTDLKTIWKNDAYQNFRENYRDTCGNCDLWTVDMIDQPTAEPKVAPVPDLPAAN